MILLVVSLFFRFQILILSCVVPEPIYGHLMRGIIVTGLLSQPVPKGKRGYPTKFYTGGFRLEVQLLPFYTIDRKDTPFVYLLLKNGTPLYLPTW